MINSKTIILLVALLFAGAFSFAQNNTKSSLQQKAETEEAAGKTASARSLYMRAFNDYAGHGQMQQGVPCGVKAAMYLYTDGSYKEAFEWLRNIDQAIMADKNLTDAGKSALRYQTSRERMKMYMRMHRSANAGEQLGIMEGYARAAADDDVTADLLYNKTIYSYAVGKTAQGRLQSADYYIDRIAVYFTQTLGIFNHRSVGASSRLFAGRIKILASSAFCRRVMRDH